jgi:hypothetical protein
MTQNIRLVLSVAIVFIVCLATSLANASAFTLTVRITDANAIERQLGTCDSGYYVIGMVDGRPRSYSFHDGIASIPVRNTVHTAPHIELACAGIDRGMPATGVSVEMN